MKTLRTTRDFRYHGDAAGFSSGRVCRGRDRSIAGTEQIHAAGRTVGRRAHRAARIQRVSLSTPEIADAMVTSPREMLVHGKAPGTISLLVWSDNGAHHELRSDRAPRPDAARRPDSPAVPQRADRGRRQRQGRRAVGRRVREARHRHAPKALAVGYVEKPENIVNMMRQTGERRRPTR